MKYLMAIIQPHRLEDVKDGLSIIGVQGMTVTEVRGFGRQRGHSERYRGSEYEVEFVPKLRLEIFVPDGLAEQAQAAIVKNAKTGNIGDGKIFISPCTEASRIRTGETGDAVLQ